MTTVSFASQFVNSQKTLFGVAGCEKEKMVGHSNLDLFVENVSGYETREDMSLLFDEYVGKVSRIVFIKHEDSDVKDMVVHFEYWYDDVFTQTLRSELIMANEHNKHWPHNESVQLKVDGDYSNLYYQIYTFDDCYYY